MRKRRGFTCPRAGEWRPTTCSPTSWCGSRATTIRGTDRIALSPDGKTSVRARARCAEMDRRRRGDRRPASLRSTSPATPHNTQFSDDGRYVYFESGRQHADDGRRRRGARRRSSRRSVPSVTWCGRSRSTDKQTLLFANINDFLGFEVAELKTGKMLHHVEVPGVTAGRVADARHPEPRDRDDAGRDRDLDCRQREQLPARSSTRR